MSTDASEVKDETRSAGECFCQGAGPAFTAFAKAFGPPEAAATHFRQARIEFLKGLREVIDARIQSLANQPCQKGTKIVVD